MIFLHFGLFVISLSSFSVCNKPSLLNHIYRVLYVYSNTITLNDSINISSSSIIINKSFITSIIHYCYCHSNYQINVVNFSSKQTLYPLATTTTTTILPQIFLVLFIFDRVFYFISFFPPFFSKYLPFDYNSFSIHVVLRHLLYFLKST